MTLDVVEYCFADVRVEDLDCPVEFWIGVWARVCGAVETEAPCVVVVSAVDDEFVAVAVGCSCALVPRGALLALRSSVGGSGRGILLCGMMEHRREQKNYE